MRGGHTFGTRSVSSFDAASLRQGLASPGMDTRYWCSRGTVGTMSDDGTFDPTDPHAVCNGPEGVECDVKLEPLEQMVVALWAGSMGGDVTDLSPIHPGDQVLVECPGGDLTLPVITHILHSRANKQPMVAGVPIFDNKRRLVYVKRGDLDVRATEGKISLAAGPTSVWVKQDQVQLGAGDATEELVLGTSYRQAEDQMLAGLESGLTAMSSAASGPLAPLQPGITACLQAVTQFISAAAAARAFLSSTVRTI